MKKIKSILLTGVLALSLVGCVTTKPVALHDSLAVTSEPIGATVYVKKLNGEFTPFELESNDSSRVDNSYFKDFENSNAERVATDDAEEIVLGEMNTETVEVFTAQTPTRFSLHRKGHYAVVIVKDGYVMQTQLVQDKLTGGEVVGNVAKTTGAVVGATALTLFTGPIGLAVLAGSAAKKAKNVKSGKNKELSPNPLNVVLEPNEKIQLSDN